MPKTSSFNPPETITKDKSDDIAKESNSPPIGTSSSEAGAATLKQSSNSDGATDGSTVAENGKGLGSNPVFSSPGDESDDEFQPLKRFKNRMKEKVS